MLRSCRGEKYICIRQTQIYECIYERMKGEQNAEDAEREAMAAFEEADLNNMDVIESRTYGVVDENGEEQYLY